MPASEVGVAERTLNFTAGGVVAGSLIGLASAAYSKPAVGEATLAYVGKTTGGHAAMFAAMAGIFAATDTFLDQSRGHSALNSVAAGCAAGAVVGARQGDPTRAAFGCALFGTVQALGEPPEMSSRPHAFSLTLPRCSCVPSQARWASGRPVAGTNSVQPIRKACSWEPVCMSGQRQRRGNLRCMSLRRTKGVRGVQWNATAGCNTRPQGPGRVGCVSGTTRPKNAQSNAQGRRAQANSKLSCRSAESHHARSWSTIC